jgi:adenylate kinase family enzyme
MQRVAVVGVIGSGKTTLAASVAKRLGLAHVELDALYWEPEWKVADQDVYEARVAAATSGHAWVLDGDYAQTPNGLWTRADTIIWLDYPRWVVLWRLVSRTLRRGLTRQRLWNNNRERLRVHLFSRESMFLRAWRSFPQHQRHYGHLLARMSVEGIRVVRFRSPRETRDWLARLEGPCSGGARGGGDAVL